MDSPASESVFNTPSGSDPNSVPTDMVSLQNTVAVLSAVMEQQQKEAADKQATFEAQLASMQRQLVDMRINLDGRQRVIDAQSQRIESRRHPGRRERAQARAHSNATSETSSGGGGTSYTPKGAGKGVSAMSAVGATAPSIGASASQTTNNVGHGAPAMDASSMLPASQTTNNVGHGVPAIDAAAPSMLPASRTINNVGHAMPAMGAAAPSSSTTAPDITSTIEHSMPPRVPTMMPTMGAQIRRGEALDQYAERNWHHNDIHRNNDGSLVFRSTFRPGVQGEAWSNNGHYYESRGGVVHDTTRPPRVVPQVIGARIVLLAVRPWMLELLSDAHSFKSDFLQTMTLNGWPLVAKDSSLSRHLIVCFFLNSLYRSESAHNAA